MEDRRTKEALTRFKETQETSRKAKLVYRKVEDLSFEELNKLVDGLTQIKQEINDPLRPQQPSNQLEASGSRDPFLARLSSSSHLHRSRCHQDVCYGLPYNHPCSFRDHIMVSFTIITVTALSSQSFLASISTSTAKATVPT